jgi:hypothetical protein
MQNDDPDDYRDTAHFAVLATISTNPKSMNQINDEACEMLGRYIPLNTIKSVVRRCVKEGLMAVHERKLNGNSTYIDTEAAGNQDQPARGRPG